MPGFRSHCPAGDEGDEINEAIAWITVLSMFQDFSVVEQIRFLLYLGDWLFEMRSDELDHLRFHKETVRRAMAMPFARPDE